MHRRFLKYAFVGLCMICFFPSCEKDSDAPVGTAVGKIVMTVTAQHHHWAVPGLPVYLKYHATEFPGTNTAAYDLNGTTDQGGGVQFKQLTPGNYYLYAYGWDPVIGDTVHGQMPVIVNASTTGGNLIDVLLYVTE